MKFVEIFLILLIAVGNVCARSYDLLFHKGDGETVALGNGDTKDVRLRVMNPQENSAKTLGFELVRPFFIIDGIYLSTDGARTLDGLEKETMQFGLTDMLSELGYTPILVQFSETVRNSLQENAEMFAGILHFINDNPYFGFSNKTEDGIIVFGISQGGILGRYGAYRYDISRNTEEAPIRIYGSLDSPHQGAIIPKGLYYTLDFWGTKGGSDAASAFSQLIEAPGASDLLLISSEGSDGNKTFAENISSERFLFGEYRKACEYKGFPSVLIAQGQMKGVSPSHASKYFKLNRKAKKLGIVMGRAQSEMNISNVGENQIAHNRLYKILERKSKYVYKEKDESRTVKAYAPFDFVQGSTYPFAKTLYESLRAGFEDAMPENMTLVGNVSLSTSWDSDTLMQKNSTFIPTTSAMDLQCGGDLSVKNGCAFTEKYSDVAFENPGSRSTANAVYAVDPTHPRYAEAMSGRHVELPVSSSGDIDTTVLRGMQMDIWRFLCQVAKYDYDATEEAFRNRFLIRFFTPDVNCMDLNQIPEIIKIAGLNNTKKFAYARYDYNASAYEKDDEVSFKVPAGWHKVASYDYGKGLPSGGNFVVDVTVKNATSSWMKAELLLFRAKNGASQIQLQEMDVPVDGSTVTLRWPLNIAENALSKYRWFRLVLNSDGADVVVSNPRFERVVLDYAEPTQKMTNMIYPNNSVTTKPWAKSTTLIPYADGLGSGLQINFGANAPGLIFDFGESKNLSDYSMLKVTYWPGTCQSTRAYFDTYKDAKSLLTGGYADAGLVSKRFPLKDVINTKVTPKNGLSASRFVLETSKRGEQCIVSKIILE